jgi:MoaA/NifB/PqqE/SkfB family radical SAM enzyme
MKCPHCYAETFAKTQGIEFDILKDAFDEFYELGVYHYVLQGGEPISDPMRLEKILPLLHPDETYINCASNGWAMTLDKIRWLKEFKVDKLTYSLDSGIESEHDAGRIQGSFRKVMEAIDHTLNEGLLSSISTVVTHSSLYSEGFKRAYEFAKSKGIRMDIQIAEPVGKWDGKTENLIFPEDAIFIKNLQKISPVLKNGLIMINRDVYSGAFDHCPAGTEFMGLTADGRLLPCNFLQFSLGNIKDKTIKQMRDDLLTSPWFDGKHPTCICGENQEFIKKFITPFTEKEKPLDAYAVFGLQTEVTL